MRVGVEPAEREDGREPTRRVPTHETPIWRYMPMKKLERLLATQQLHLCRASKFEDDHEGSVTAGSEAELAEFEAIVRASPEDMAYFRSEHAKTRNQVAVCCWHKAAHETEGMWGVTNSSTASGLGPVRVSALPFAVRIGVTRGAGDLNLSHGPGELTRTAPSRLWAAGLTGTVRADEVCAARLGDGRLSFLALPEVLEIAAARRLWHARAVMTRTS